MGLINPAHGNRGFGWAGRVCGALLLAFAASGVSAQCYLPEDGERTQPPQQALAPAGGIGQAAGAVSKPRLNFGMLVKVRNALQRVVSDEIPIYVCDEIEPGATADSDGFVKITSGLLSKIGDNENIASIVVGHEFAHIVDRHFDYKRNYVRNVDVSARRAVVDSDSGSRRAVSQAAVKWQRASKLKYQRDLEYAADARGLEFAVAAGFNPWVAIKLYIEILTEEDKDESEHDHPLLGNRVARLWALYEDELKRGKYVQQAGDQATRNESYKTRLDDLLARRRGGEATKLVDAWLVEIPESGLAWFYRGTMIRRQRPGDVRGIEALERAVTYDPNNRELWLVFCVAANKYDHRRESAHCARYLKYREDREEHAEKVFDGRLFVGGLEQKPPKALLIAKDEDGKKLITNDPTILGARGLSGESVAPWHLLRRPR